MKKRAVPIALISLLLGLGFDWLFYGKIPGVSVFLYTAIILSFTGYFIWQFQHPINKSLYWLAPTTLFFSFMVFVRANPFLVFVDICLTIYLLMMVAHLGQKPALSLRQFDIPRYFTLACIMPLNVLRESFQFLTRAISNRSTTAQKSSYLPIIRGIMLSLPILFVFLLLLSSADLVFKNLLSTLFHLDVNSEIVSHLILIGFVSSLFSGAYAYIFMPALVPETNPAPARKPFALGTTESSIILGSVSTLFLVFVMIQFAYLFGGSGQIAATGHTYAEYARKGFFELIAVAAISLALILSIKKSTVFRTIQQVIVFKWMSGLLIAEVLVIMLSAHMRLNLYEDAYGFTTLRLWSHFFIAWLAFAFGLLGFHIIREKGEKNFAFQLFISVLCFFALINIINPDNFIARQNISRFNDTGKIDLNYLGNLSEDATPAIAGLIDNPNERLQKSAANILYRQKQFRTDNADHWQSVNAARQRADQIFHDNAAQIEAAKSYSEYRELNAR